ncbi:hypothetical protein JOF29_004534 [Kribbella aluminosa]|uniref:DUF4411 family protein n=1 Tax=Kribbella aluminosa TaxID=416017 RepID=A0ABS4UPE1_9ACTN|nr:DUF4411 family protein [Kribbella aluminosa]MBP2353424.1 hypothetical protein [Kribbella aluminosa]
MYVLDANVFISAKNAHYGMDFVPGFWTWLRTAHASGVVCSVEAVRDELLDGADELADWVRTLPRSFFISVDAAALVELHKLSAWSKQTPQYTQAAVATFLASADYFLVGQARALGFTVVTHEMPAPESKKRILIPNACDAVGASYCLPWKLLREQSVRLVV